MKCSIAGCDRSCFGGCLRCGSSVCSNHCLGHGESGLTSCCDLCRGKFEHPSDGTSSFIAFVMLFLIVSITIILISI